LLEKVVDWVWIDENLQLERKVETAVMMYVSMLIWVTWRSIQIPESRNLQV